MTNRVAARQLRVLEACDRANADNSLAKAVEYLGAVEIAPGRYAFTMLQRDHADWRNVTAQVSRYEWFTASADALAVYSSEEYSEAYWLQAYAKRMPPWWSPSQRFAWRKAFGFADSPNILGRGGVRYASINEARLHGPNERHERITADLTTGEEVPA